MNEDRRGAFGRRLERQCAVLGDDAPACGLEQLHPQLPVGVCLVGAFRRRAARRRRRLALLLPSARRQHEHAHEDGNDPHAHGLLLVVKPRRAGLYPFRFQPTSSSRATLAVRSPIASSIVRLPRALASPCCRAATISPTAMPARSRVGLSVPLPLTSCGRCASSSKATASGRRPSLPRSPRRTACCSGTCGRVGAVARWQRGERASARDLAVQQLPRQPGPACAVCSVSGRAYVLV